MTKEQYVRSLRNEVIQLRDCADKIVTGAHPNPDVCLKDAADRIEELVEKLVNNGIDIATVNLFVDHTSHEKLMSDALDRISNILGVTASETTKVKEIRKLMVQLRLALAMGEMVR